MWFAVGFLCGVALMVSGILLLEWVDNNKNKPGGGKSAW